MRKQWTILSQAAAMRKVQRLERKLVGSSDPKRPTPLKKGDDIVSSAKKFVAAQMSGLEVTNLIEELVQITANAIRDNLYKDAWPRATESGKDSMRQAKNIQGASVLNNGFNANFPVSDGQPLFSLTHPVYGNTVANTFAIPTQLNETALQDGLIGIQQFLNASGIRIALGAEKLIIPPQLQFTADVLLGSKYRTATANNDISAIYNLSSVPMGWRVNQFLASPTAWFITTNESNGFKYYERDPLSIDMFTDTTTRNLNVTFVERYSFGCSNWRAAFGSQGV